MEREVENPMVVDACWPEEEEEEREDKWERFCRLADEQYDGRFD